VRGTMRSWRRNSPASGAESRVVNLRFNEGGWQENGEEQKR
jgi:hypothetical protein